MEKEPNRDINAEERMRAISLILMQQMVLNKTLQQVDLKELYEQLSLKDPASLVIQANRESHALEGLSPQHRTALALRIAQEVFDRDPFSQ